MTTELLPCPFPHKHEEFEASSSYAQRNDGKKTYYIECVTCGCCGPIAGTPEGAAKLWQALNARPAAEPHPQDARSADAVALAGLITKTGLSVDMYDRRFVDADGIKAIEAFRQHIWAEAMSEAAKLCNDESDNSSDAGSTYDDGAGSCGYEKACRVLEEKFRALTPLERKDG